MKVWIGICLLWLMARVASASPIMTTSVAPSQEDLGVFGYSKVQMSLSHIRPVKLSQMDGDQLNAKVEKLISSYSTFEGLLRGPFADSNLEVPRPALRLNSKEIEVYNVLAQEKLYPEMRVVSAIIKSLKREILERGSLLPLKERALIQTECFSKNNYSFSCLLAKGVTPKVESILREGISKEITSALDISRATDALLEIIEEQSEESESLVVARKDAFTADAAHHWMNRHSVKSLLLKCISFPEPFTTQQLVGQSRCQKAFQEDFSKSQLEGDTIHDIVSMLMNPYGVFKLMVDSLGESALKFRIVCLTSDVYSCKWKRFDSRLEDWPYMNQFTLQEKRVLIRSLIRNWKQ